MTEPAAETHWRRQKHWLLGLCALGLLLSAWLEVIHVRTYLAPTRESFCSLGSNFDCVSVAASRASTFLGVPWAVWGMLGFIVLGTAVLRRSLWLVPLALGGAAVSLLLLAVALFSVGSICLVCEAVHVVTWLVAGLSLWARSSLRRDWSDGTTLYAVFVPSLTLALTAALFLPRYWAAFSYKSDPPFPTGKTAEGEPWIGAEEPLLVLHEFVDYRCPHCAAASTRTLRWLEKEPGLRVVRHQQPGSMCRVGTRSCQAVRLAYCAEEQGKFWRADRWLFAHAVGGKPVDSRAMARDLQLDPVALDTCSRRADVYDRATREYRYAKSQKVIDVPGYVVLGRRLRPHQLEAALEEHLR